MSTPTGILFSDPQAKPLSTTGQFQAGAYLLFFQTGTLTPANVYADGLLTTPLSQTPGTAQPSCTADSAGRFNQIYMDPTVAYRVQLYNQGGTKLEDTDPYIPGGIAGGFTQTSVGAILWPKTAAETTASITPTTYAYPEGDIRRYGALTSASNNSNAINAALQVSSTLAYSNPTAGSAAYLPPGTWSITNSLVAPPGSSMYGNGRSSIISCANGVDGIQFNSPDAGVIAQPRFFRDFQIVGTLSGTTNNAHGINIDASSLAVDQVLFSNLAILNFNWGVEAQNLEDSTFFNCYIQNCWNGILFNLQSANVWITNCIIQLTSAGTLITGSGNSQGIACQGNPYVQALHIFGGTIYGYQFDINLGLCLEVQIEAVDVSAASLCPIAISSTIDGLVIRDCWIELGASSGSFSSNGSMCGIYVQAITATTSAKIHITGNYINADNPIAGSTGVYVGNSNNGITVTDNHILGFDIGVGGGNGTLTSGSNMNGAVIRDNTIDIVNFATYPNAVYSANSGAIFFGSSSNDCSIGPNYIAPGTGAAATASAGTAITVPNQTTNGNQVFPVNTPVQCTTTAAGFTAGVTYWVASSAGTTVTLATTKGGSVISGTAATSIGSLIQAPVPVIFAAGTPPGTTLFARGACIVTLSDPAVSGAMFWQASGKTVSLSLLSSLTGTSTATTMTATGVPPFLAPTTGHNFFASVENSGAGTVGMGTVASVSAALAFYLTVSAAAFTASGTKGLLGCDMSYSLA